VSPARLEEARATMIELFPEGFEEVDRPEGVELAAYTDAAGEERLWHFFGGARSHDVEEDWGDRWREFHRPVRVGSLWVGPPWLTSPSGVIEVVVDPGRAFGTGAHATTQLCLQFLQELEPGPLLDVGCGSGVLSIAAALLGYEPVLAVDVEAAAIEATLANAAANGVDISARLVDVDAALPPMPTAVANISLELVRSLPSRLDAATLVTSGYLADETAELAGYVRAEHRTLGGWAAELHRLA